MLTYNIKMFFFSENVEVAAKIKNLVALQLFCWLKEGIFDIVDIVADFLKLVRISK